MAKGNLSKDQKRELAQELYMNTDLHQKQICEVVGWTEKTFSENKKKYSWEQLKAAGTVTNKKIIANLYQKLFTLSGNAEANADDIAKISSSIEKLSDKRTTVAHYINVFKEMGIYLLGIDPELAKTMNVHHQNFIQDKLNGSN